MYIIREFNLIGGKIDFQYVSSIEYKNGKMLVGYDAKKEYAIKLTPYQLKRVLSDFKYIGCKYKTAEVV